LASCFRGWAGYCISSQPALPWLAAGLSIDIASQSEGQPELPAASRLRQRQA